MLHFRKIWKIPSDAHMLVFAYNDDQTPASSRFLIFLAFIYLLSPIDFVPDFVPFAGWIDDLIIVPSIILLVKNQLPPLVLLKARKKAQKYRSLFVIFALVFILCLILILFSIIRMLFF